MNDTIKPNIYLDVDGVILANENHAANYAHEFLELVTKNYPTYWLTTHCLGDASTVVGRLSCDPSPLHSSLSL